MIKVHTFNQNHIKVIQKIMTERKFATSYFILSYFFPFFPKKSAMYYISLERGCDADSETTPTFVIDQKLTFQKTF